MMAVITCKPGLGKNTELGASRESTITKPGLWRGEGKDVSGAPVWSNGNGKVLLRPRVHNLTTAIYNSSSPLFRDGNSPTTMAPRVPGLFQIYR